MERQYRKPVEQVLLDRWFGRKGVSLAELGLAAYWSDDLKGLRLGYELGRVHEHCQWLYSGQVMEMDDILWVPYEGPRCIQHFPGANDRRIEMTSHNVITLARALAFDTKLKASEMNLEFQVVDMTLAMRLLPGVLPNRVLTLLEQHGIEELHELAAHTSQWVQRNPEFEGMPPTLVRRMNGLAR